jgi:hypothetical protein
MALISILIKSVVNEQGLYYYLFERRKKCTPAQKLKTKVKNRRAEDLRIPSTSFNADQNFHSKLSSAKIQLRIMPSNENSRSNRSMVDGRISCTSGTGVFLAGLPEGASLKRTLFQRLKIYSSARSVFGLGLIVCM